MDAALDRGGPEHQGSVSDYCILNGSPDARLSDVERLTVLGGTGLERVLSMLSRNLSRFTLDDIAPGLTLDSLDRDAERIAKARRAGVVSALLAPPREMACFSAFPIHGFQDGAVFDLAYPSPFMPEQVGAVDPDYSSISENATSYVRLWEHSTPSASRLTVIAVHGWTMGDQRVNSIAFLPGLFFSLGFDVALVELPFHGRRRPLLPDPSALFPSADPVRTLVATSHAIRDLRTLKTILSARGHSKFACIGMSLGAYIGQLWCSLDVLDKGVFLVPLVSMGDIAWSLVKRHLNESGARFGITRTAVRDLFRDHCALEYECATREESLLVMCGRGDQVVPRAQVGLLRRHWPRATFRWMNGGHGAHVRKGDTFRQIVEFLEQP